MQPAACYLRSTKDRHDVSIDVQRQQLHTFADHLGLTLAEEFADAVESGKDEDRPGFQRLLQSVRNPRRGWSTLLVLDTSRLARRRHIAILFEEMEAAPRGVRVVYKTLPEAMDPGAEVILKSAMQAQDEWHSINSRQKGLAGMAHNVEAGFRAGGRAPFGYRLVREPTGAMRDGMPVTKSRLEPSEDASIVQAYLHDRAAGTPRMQAARRHGLHLTQSSLVGVEWNALTYAGFTVWNVHAPRAHGHYIGGAKRRPRSEWKMHAGTHTALITDAEAETILTRLAAYSVRRPRRSDGTYLLTGVLRTPAGARWYGNGYKNAYRVRGCCVAREPLEIAVLAKFTQDLQAPRFVNALLGAASAERSNLAANTHARAMRERVTDLTTRISRMMDLAADMATPGPALRKIDALEAERKTALAALATHEAERAQYAPLAELTAQDVRQALVDLATNIRQTDRDQVKDALGALVERIDLDPATMACTIHYRVRPTTGVGLEGGLRTCSRGDATLSHPSPALRVVLPLVLPAELRKRQELRT